MPVSNSPACFDLSTVFVANGLAPHFSSGDVVTTNLGSTGSTTNSQKNPSGTYMTSPAIFIPSSSANSGIIGSTHLLSNGTTGLLLPNGAVNVPDSISMATMNNNANHRMYGSSYNSVNTCQQHYGHHGSTYAHNTNNSAVLYNGFKYNNSNSYHRHGGYVNNGSSNSGGKSYRFNSSKHSSNVGSSYYNQTNSHHHHHAHSNNHHSQQSNSYHGSTFSPSNNTNSSNNTSNHLLSMNPIDGSSLNYSTVSNANISSSNASALNKSSKNITTSYHGNNKTLIKSSLHHVYSNSNRSTHSSKNKANNSSSIENSVHCSTNQLDVNANHFVSSSSTINSIQSQPSFQINGKSSKEDQNTSTNKNRLTQSVIDSSLVNQNSVANVAGDPKQSNQSIGPHHSNRTYSSSANINQSYRSGAPKTNGLAAASASESNYRIEKSRRDQNHNRSNGSASASSKSSLGYSQRTSQRNGGSSQNYSTSSTNEQPFNLLANAFPPLPGSENDESNLLKLTNVKAYKNQNNESKKVDNCFDLVEKYSTPALKEDKIHEKVLNDSDASSSLSHNANTNVQNKFASVCSKTSHKNLSTVENISKKLDLTSLSSSDTSSKLSSTKICTNEKENIRFSSDSRNETNSISSETESKTLDPNVDKNEIEDLNDDIEMNDNQSNSSKLTYSQITQRGNFDSWSSLIIDLSDSNSLMICIDLRSESLN